LVDFCRGLWWFFTFGLCAFMPWTMLVVHLGPHSHVPRTMLVVHLGMCSSMLRVYLVVLLMGLFALMPRIHKILMGGSLWIIRAWALVHVETICSKVWWVIQCLYLENFSNLQLVYRLANFLVGNHPFQCLFYLLFLNMKILVIFSIILFDV
jgi:hypothetical protein